MLLKKVVLSLLLWLWLWVLVLLLLPEVLIATVVIIRFFFSSSYEDDFLGGFPLFFQNMLEMSDILTHVWGVLQCWSNKVIYVLFVICLDC
jgi:hypothetical protein